MGDTPREIVEEVLSPGMVKQIWTGNYEKVLPISIQNFDLKAVLPAVFYMFRYGYRRGKGKFFHVFAGGSGNERESRSAATIERVAEKLADTEFFEGFHGETEKAILGDMLLAFCLENKNKALGRQEQIQRVTPAHYMASWVDLPDKVAHLRYVPEMIVAMLADQKGDFIEQTKEVDKTWFPVGYGFESNVLLKPFSKGIIRKGLLGDKAADRFDENEQVGLDQLLMIRLAQMLGSAPDKLHGGEGDKISNQRPIANHRARHFSEDLRRFIRAYAEVIPRQAFVELLESCISVGLATILTSVIELLFNWAETGIVTNNEDEQKPALLFVDCSNGVDRRLRTIAENSMDDFMRRIERFPVILMALRLLDHSVKYDIKLKQLKLPTRPYATEWLNLLGDILHNRRDEAKAILYNMEQKAQELAEKLENKYEDAANILKDYNTEPNPVWRLAEALTSLQGRGNTQSILIKLYDSIFLMNQPNGLGLKRSVVRQDPLSSTRKRREVRALVFTDAVLDYLVHVSVLSSGNPKSVKSLSFKDLIRNIRERYGFFIDIAPPGIDISNELLQLNRIILERRLRDLGLIVSVSDAEAMKYVKTRFNPSEE